MNTLRAASLRNSGTERILHHPYDRQLRDTHRVIIEEWYRTIFPRMLYAMDNIRTCLFVVPLAGNLGLKVVLRHPMNDDDDRHHVTDSAHPHLSVVQPWDIYQS